MLKKLQELKDNVEVYEEDNTVNLDADDFHWMLKSLATKFGGLREEARSVIDDFLGERCVIGDDEEVRENHLYYVFLEWAVENKKIALSVEEFRKLLSGRLKMHRHHGVIWHVGLKK